MGNEDSACLLTVLPTPEAPRPAHLHQSPFQEAPNQGAPDSSRTRLHPTASLVPGQETRGVHAAMKHHLLILFGSFGYFIFVKTMYMH